jgi:hypothetical protein
MLVVLSVSYNPLTYMTNLLVQLSQHLAALLGYHPPVRINSERARQTVSDTRQLSQSTVKVD